MITINGHWFAAGSSTRYAAELALTGNTFSLSVDKEVRQSGELDSLNISQRLGNVPRKIYFADGSLFETFENDSLEGALKASGLKSGDSFIHKMESSWRWIAVSLVLTVSLALAFFKWGLPWTAEKVAYALPIPVHEAASSGALTFMDKVMFSPSELDAATKLNVRKRFDALLVDIPDQGFNFKLHFRRLGDMPNAFALPSGEIVVMDALVQMSDPLEELDSVLLHEMGHVLQRHGMQQVIQASTLTLIASLAVGDVSGLGELATGIPIFLMQSSYSRAAESSADDFAFEQMTRLGIDPKYFASMIMKLENFEPESSEGEAKKDDETELHADTGQKESFPEYLSTHPDSGNRAQRAREMSERFNAQ